jgi:ubiquinone/menaquinone biosynthesis C-methylase UbiE
MTSNIPPQAMMLLGCTKCGSAPLTLQADVVVCGRCGWSARVVDNVVDTRSDVSEADFDTLYETMEENNAADVITKIMYERQSALVGSVMKPGMVVLDIGCGPAVPYKKTPGAFLVGLDPSLPSVRRNASLDLALCCSATELPLASQSVDLVVCFYSIHHMVGDRISETAANVDKAFSEFARVLKPDGRLLVFEVCPWPMFGAVQNFLWPVARRLLGKTINYYFWREPRLRKLVTRHFPGKPYESVKFSSDLFAFFPPIFRLQWLRVPRILYPFNITMVTCSGSSSAGRTLA